MELHEKIQQLARILKESDLGEILVEEEGVRIRLRTRAPEGVREVVSLPSMPAYAPPPPYAAYPGAPAPGGSPALAPSAPAAAAAADEGLVPFTSPMVGTFYRASSPDAKAFVREGDVVGPESTLCIIEAMKVMNEIKAETSGQIVKVLVENGEPVEFGQDLFLIRPS